MKIRSYQRSRFCSLRDIAVFLAGLEIKNIEVNLDNLRDAFRVCLREDIQTRTATYRAFLGRFPEDSVPRSGYRDPEEAADHLIEALMSHELAENFFHIACSNFPEARRIIFLHIPKTAGTEINNRLQKIDGQFITHAPQDPFERAQSFIRFLIEQAKRPDQPIIIAGHYELSHLDRLGLIRRQDICMTILRDPRDIVISHVNYILTVCFAYPERADGIEFRENIRKIGISLPRKRSDISPSIINSLIISEYFSTIAKNSLSKYLKCSNKCAIDYICDIVPINLINEFMNDRFSVASNSASNISHKFVESFSNLPINLQKYIIENIINEDIHFYNDLINNRAGIRYRAYTRMKI